MLKNKSKIITIFLILVLLFSNSLVFADNNDIALISETNQTQPVDVDLSNSPNDEQTEQTDEIEQQENNYKTSDVYLVGDEVTIDYIVDGNLFIMANKVTINSQIGGDAFILAKDVVVDSEGYIFNNLFDCAQSISIKGIVYDVYACAENLSIDSGYIYRDLKSVSKNLAINGIVRRNAFVKSSNITFGYNEVSGTNGTIYGNLEYSAKNEANIPEGCVEGDVKFSKIETESAEVSVATVVADYLLDLGAFLAFVIIIWLVCLWLAPKFLASTNKFVGKSSWKVLGFGALTLIAIPVICFILLLIQLTSGFSLLLLALYILALVVSKSLFTITANKYLCTKLNITKNSGIFGMLIVTSIIVWVLTQLPYVGGFLSFVSVVLGLGVLVLSILPKKSETNNSSSKEVGTETK